MLSPLLTGQFLSPPGWSTDSFLTPMTRWWVDTSLVLTHWHAVDYHHVSVMFTCKCVCLSLHLMCVCVSGPQARTILMQSSLPQTQLATIWWVHWNLTLHIRTENSSPLNLTFSFHVFPLRSLSDIDQDGKLTAEEFILAMHLIDMAMSGLPLPPVLPPEYLPPSFR